MNELHLFAGCGGGILGGILLGHRTICAVEIVETRRKRLLRRQRDGLLPRFPIWDDVSTFDGRPWRGLVDVVCGGFPCQDIAISSSTESGLDGERSGLWFQMARIVREVRPRYAFVENSPVLTLRGLDRVLAEFAKMGYDARWGTFSASDVGAPHIRERLFILANAEKERRGKVREVQSVDADQMLRWGLFTREAKLQLRETLWEESELASMGVADGFPVDLDGISACGDAQVPAVVKLAWDCLSKTI